MSTFILRDEPTREFDLVNWQSFTLAYYQPVLRALKLLRVPERDVEDLAHSFLLKASETDFLETFRAFRRRQEKDGRRVRFRTYLYRSIQNYVRDFYRRTGAGVRVRDLDIDAVETLVENPAQTLDPDTMYAIDIFHQAIQALKRHYEQNGKPHFWVIFEETFLADEFPGRRGKTRAELREMFGLTPQQLDNVLTTTKRTFRRVIEEVIPRGQRGGRAGERFEEWMTIFRESNASRFNLLHAAYPSTIKMTDPTDLIEHASHEDAVERT